MAFPISPAELTQAMESVNGKLFRWLPGYGLITGVHTTAPIADVTSRGLMGTVRGATTVSDQQTIVAKDAADAYAARVMPVLGTDILVQTNVADFALTDVATAQPLFEAVNDVVTLDANASYILDGVFHIHTAGTAAHTLGIILLPSSALTSIGYGVQVSRTATEVPGAAESAWAAVATVTVVTTTVSAASHHTLTLNGVLRTNAATTITPQMIWSGAPGAVGAVLANSYLRYMKFGIKTANGTGPVA